MDAAARSGSMIVGVDTAAAADIGAAVAADKGAAAAAVTAVLALTAVFGPTAPTMRQTVGQAKVNAEDAGCRAGISAAETMCPIEGALMVSSLRNSLCLKLERGNGGCRGSHRATVASRS